ncbi:MAG: hypothetical protein ACI4JA_10130 [Oscillospiraceae bacterium]
MKFVEAETHYGRLRIAKVTAEYPHEEGFSRSQAEYAVDTLGY